MYVLLHQHKQAQKRILNNERFVGKEVKNVNLCELQT